VTYTDFCVFALFVVWDIPDNVFFQSKRKKALTHILLFRYALPWHLFNHFLKMAD